MGGQVFTIIISRRSEHYEDSIDDPNGVVPGDGGDRRAD
jgi:hypothetical protein